MVKKATENEPDGRITLSLKSAGKEIGVSADTVWRWSQNGHLPVFIPPGVVRSNTKPGPRGYQVFRSDWETFKRRQTFVGGAPMNPPEPIEKLKAVEVGEYGQRRRRPR